MRYIDHRNRSQLIICITSSFFSHNTKQCPPEIKEAFKKILKFSVIVVFKDSGAFNQHLFSQKTLEPIYSSEGLFLPLQYALRNCFSHPKVLLPLMPLGSASTLGRSTANFAISIHQIKAGVGVMFPKVITSVDPGHYSKIRRGH